MTKVSENTAALPDELSLDKAKQGRSYMIVANAATGRDRMHMDCLGLIPGDAVHVLFSNFAGLVIAIKGSRLALGRPQAAYLTVREFQDSDWPEDVTP